MTKDFQPLGEMESRFAEIIWQNAPLPSGELVKLCQQQLGWKKSTTYTMLRRLCTKGLFVNQDGQVQALLSQADFLARQSEDFLAQNFAGSLPRFLTAFCSQQIRILTAVGVFLRAFYFLVFLIRVNHDLSVF